MADWVTDRFWCSGGLAGWPVLWSRVQRRRCPLFAATTPSRFQPCCRVSAPSCRLTIAPPTGHLQDHTTFILQTADGAPWIWPRHPPLATNDRAGSHWSSRRPDPTSSACPGAIMPSRCTVADPNAAAASPGLLPRRCTTPPPRTRRHRLVWSLSARPGSVHRALSELMLSLPIPGGWRRRQDPLVDRASLLDSLDRGPRGYALDKPPRPAEVRLLRLRHRRHPASGAE